MASLRCIKKDINYLVNEVVSDCYTALYFKDQSKREDIIAIMEEAVDFRNQMIDRANHPAEKKSKSLVRKHYQQMRRDMMRQIDALFEKLSAICK